MIGALQAGVTNTVSFDVAIDLGSSQGGGGSNYTVQLIAFAPGAVRNDCRSTPTGSDVLASKTGKAASTNLSGPITFSYTTNSSFPGVGYDLGVRLVGQTAAAIIDNVQVVITAGVTLASTNAYLSSLVLSPVGALSPSFSSITFSYTASEAYGASPTVTVVNADLTATNGLIYNGTTNLLASGVASSPLALSLGVVNPVVVRVTAQDGLTVKSYTVNVTMAPSLTPPTLTRLVSGSTLTLSWPADHLGYTLQMKTNALNQGLNGGTWYPVAGSSAVTSTNLPINNTSGTVFYRLAYP